MRGHGQHMCRLPAARAMTRCTRSGGTCSCCIGCPSSCCRGCPAAGWHPWLTLSQLHHARSAPSPARLPPKAAMPDLQPVGGGESSPREGLGKGGEAWRCMCMFMQLRLQERPNVCGNRQSLGSSSLSTLHSCLRSKLESMGPQVPGATPITGGLF